MLRIFVLVLVTVLLAGCSPERPEPAAEAGRPEPAAEAGRPTEPATGTGTGFNATDVAWLQLAEALHTRALPLLELAPGRSASGPLADLAARLGKEHDTERGRLRALLATARVTGENPHAAHDMPGMPTADDLRKLRGLRDETFDGRFAALLRAYLDQLVLVARGEQSAGAAPQARELAAAMERAHAADLTELDGIGIAAR
ncbi:DUF305 domain-containing protein [Nonomuraea sp. NPDC002799]